MSKILNQIYFCEKFPIILDKIMNKEILTKEETKGFFDTICNHAEILKTDLENKQRNYKISLFLLSFNLIDPYIISKVEDTRNKISFINDIIRYVEGFLLSVTVLIEEDYKNIEVIYRIALLYKTYLSFFNRSYEWLNDGNERAKALIEIESDTFFEAMDYVDDEVFKNS